MPSILRVFLLLAVVICISESMVSDSGSSCLCRRVKKGLMPGAEISNIQVHQPSIFCNKIEIVITPKGVNHPYCVNPTSPAGKKILDVFMAKETKSSANSTSPL